MRLRLKTQLILAISGMAVAVVVGRTAMRGQVGGEEFSTASRYTHVFARTGGGDWRLVSAQGTPIVE